MASCARIGDPISHGGTILTGSSDVFAEGQGVARVGDLVMCDEHRITINQHWISNRDHQWQTNRSCR